MGNTGSHGATPILLAVCLVPVTPGAVCDLPFGPAVETLVSGDFSWLTESSF